MKSQYQIGDALELEGIGIGRIYAKADGYLFLLMDQPFDRWGDGSLCNIAVITEIALEIKRDGHGKTGNLNTLVDNDYS